MGLGLTHGEVLAQLVQVPLIGGRGNVTTATARQSELKPIALPFWDDFSFTAGDGYVNDTLWINAKSTWVNNGLTIDPPSVFVATFDGLDSIGKPYNPTDLLAKGFADKMVSRGIKLDLIPNTEKTSVFLSFYFQYQGNGEPSDRDDNLSLWFKDVDGSWEKVFEATSDENYDPKKFYYRTVAIRDEKYFHSGFQFRFQNFARLSGPYDMWHLDYVYLNFGRTATEKSMPDRTISSPLTSPFGDYTAVPLRHLKDTIGSISTLQTAKLFGLLENNLQPFRYTTSLKITERTPAGINTKKVILENDEVPINPLTGGAQIIEPFKTLELTLRKKFPLTVLSPDADSVSVAMKLGINTADSNPQTYLPKYRPINFLFNDTTTRKFILADFYSSDDGEAEFGAGVNKNGNELAYGYDILTKKADTVVAVDVYFPQFGDQSNQTLNLKIWNSAEGKPLTAVHQQTITVVRSAQNRFSRYLLSQPVLVQGRVYFGWKRTSDGDLPVGLDKSRDNGKKIWYNLNGEWVQNEILSGSLMIRPVFGKGAGDVIAAALEKSDLKIWPNPTTGEFTIPGTADSIQILEPTGAFIEFTTEDTIGGKLVRLNRPTQGLKIILWSDQGVVKKSRIIVR